MYVGQSAWKSKSTWVEGASPNRTDRPIETCCQCTLALKRTRNPSRALRRRGSSEECSPRSPKSTRRLENVVGFAASTMLRAEPSVLKACGAHSSQPATPAVVWWSPQAHAHRHTPPPRPPLLHLPSFTKCVLVARRCHW